jgi:ATP-dependent Lon protease
VARKIALRHAEGDLEPITMQPGDVAPLLGPEVFPEDERRKEQPPGVATGLAWTETGGEVLYIEATLLPGGKGLTITGQIGEVMQESARAAQSYIWSHAEDLGVDPAAFREYGVHLHVPAGAVPKDGPSAGVTMATALASVYTHTPVRTDTAMTGEITLTGLVLPIGGLKEKVLAARRAGIHRIIAPKGNEKDLQDFSEAVRRETEFVFVNRIEQVLGAAFPQAAEEVETLKAG